MRNLLLILIIFFLINLSAVFPVNKQHKHQETKSKSELSLERHGQKYEEFMGSNLFDGNRKACFSPEDVNLLVARRQFEIMIPKELPPDLLDDKSVSHMLKYFYYGFYLFQRLKDGYSRRVMEKAFYDTLGGFLRYYLVPVCKFSYYASKVEPRTVRNILMLYKRCRAFLNTNGNGWRVPMKNPLIKLKSVKIDPIKVTDHNSFSDDKYCNDLDLTADSSSGTETVDDYMIVSLPKIDHEESGDYLNNIWLPFSRKRTYNLRSYQSAFILLKFYKTVIRCYKKKSLPLKFFDRKFRQWIVENIKIHLDDDQFYPGLGGILNIYETTLMGGQGDKEDLQFGDAFQDDKRETIVNEQDTVDLDNECDEIEKRESSIYKALMDLKSHKEYGDKNLNDWLLLNDELDEDNDEAPRLMERLKRKSRKKCKLKYQVKYRKCKPSSLRRKTTKKPFLKPRKKKKKCKLKYIIKYKKCKPPIQPTKKPVPKITTPIYCPEQTTNEPTVPCEETNYDLNFIVFGVAELLNLLLLIALFFMIWKTCRLKNCTREKPPNSLDCSKPKASTLKHSKCCKKTTCDKSSAKKPHKKTSEVTDKKFSFSRLFSCKKPGQITDKKNIKKSDKKSNQNLEELRKSKQKIRKEAKKCAKECAKEAKQKIEKKGRKN